MASTASRSGTAVRRARPIEGYGSLRTVVNHVHVSLRKIGDARGGSAENAIEHVVSVTSHHDEVHVELVAQLDDEPPRCPEANRRRFDPYPQRSGARDEPQQIVDRDLG